MDFFYYSNDINLIGHRCEGGELFDRICEKGSFFESDAASIIRTILDAVSYLHDQGVVHRDIKPENLLYRCKEVLAPDGSPANSSPDLVIADFGLSKLIDPQKYDLLMTTVGTPSYMAPEVIKRSGHGKPVDLWSIGVLTFFLLSGSTPFDAENSAEELQNILEANFSFEPKDIWCHVSPMGKRN